MESRTVLTAEEAELLTPREQEIILLVRIQELSDKEIAARLGLAVNTVKSHIYRCRRLLQIKKKRKSRRKPL